MQGVKYLGGEDMGVGGCDDRFGNTLGVRLHGTCGSVEIGCESQKLARCGREAMACPEPQGVLSRRQPGWC